MRRREFITLLGSVVTAWPLAARAQQPAMPVIGFLTSFLPEGRLLAFRDGLKEAGYVEGRNVKIEYRLANERNDRLPSLATELVQRQVTMIVASGTASAVAAKAASKSVPVVFGIAADPVKLDLVASLRQPGGNMTGVTDLNLDIGPKRFELIHQLVPTATVLGVLVNPTSPDLTEAILLSLQPIADAIGLRLQVLNASTEADFDQVFASLKQMGIGALIVSPDAMFNARAERLGGCRFATECRRFTSTVPSLQQAA